LRVQGCRLRVEGEGFEVDGFGLRVCGLRKGLKFTLRGVEG
jgi:hypothetical protein